jgi:hypothetical protein
LHGGIALTNAVSYVKATLSQVACDVGFVDGEGALGDGSELHQDLLQDVAVPASILGEFMASSTDRLDESLCAEILDEGTDASSAKLQLGAEFVSTYRTIGLGKGEKCRE